jgi:hypothetical protein
MTRSTPQWTWVGTASGVLFVVTQFAGFGTGAAARDFKRITLTSPSSEVAESVATPVPTAERKPARRGRRSRCWRPG